MKIIISIVSLIWSVLLTAQSDELRLEQVIRMAQAQSIAARQAATRLTTRYWEWRSFRADYRPRIVLSGRAPGFSRTSQGVVQPDGTIKFQSIAQSNILGDLTLSQPLAATGGTLFLSSNLQRFDDLQQGARLYNGTPLQIGISQPFFAFNALKWDKQIEPLRYQESQQAFIADMETIAVTALDYFFNLLIAQMDHAIAATNRTNTDTLYRITEEKFRLGKVSRNDLLQLQLETRKAEKALALAEQDLETAQLNLVSFVGSRAALQEPLALPTDLPELVIAEDVALREAKANRPDALAFHRRLLQADRDYAAVRGATGFSASLFGSLGFSKNADDLGEVYRHPPDQQQLTVEFTLPIVDWGRAKAQLETARAERELVQQEIAQDRLDFEQILRTELSLFRRYFRQVTLNREVDELAQERYQIAQERFLLGNLGITDLIIALQEKDQSRRDYLRALWDYWRGYYRLRALTLYDFANNQKIKY